MPRTRFSRVIAALAVVCLTGPAQAYPSFKTGQALSVDCGPRAAGPPSAACVDYIQGVSDSLTLLAPTRYCPPAGVTVGRVTDAVRTFLEQHPEKRDYSAASTVTLALMTTYPCGAILSTR
jgi:hypothetical protein